MEWISLNKARNLLCKYNCNVKYTRIDFKGHTLFNQSIGSNINDIKERLLYIANNYGAVRGISKNALELEITKIAKDIADTREYSSIKEMPLLIETDLSCDSIGKLFRPFNINRSKRWLVWASKYWHFNNPMCFPIIDSRVVREINIIPETMICRESIPEESTAIKYYKFTIAFKNMILRHKEWNDILREDDGYCHYGTLKMWDKILFMKSKQCKGRNK